jgi:transaldolase
MIKIPATAAGIAALEDLTAADLALNVTMILSFDQYRAARDAVWRGAQRRSNLDRFKTVYSVFVSPVDAYVEERVFGMSTAARGLVAIANAKRIWAENREFWRGKGLPLDQEIVFCGMAPRSRHDEPLKYVSALAGGDIQTNVPATNEAVNESALTFFSAINELPPTDVLAEICRNVDMGEVERVVKEKAMTAFIRHQRVILAFLHEKRAAILAAR